MSQRTKSKVKIYEQVSLIPGIYSMWIDAPEIAKEAKAGQFISVYTNDKSKLLPRPISICDIDRENGRIRMVYRVSGTNTGTEQFSKLVAGDEVDVLGPLGNGYDLNKFNELSKSEGVCVVGGGIGIPPMLGLAKELKKNNSDIKVTAVLGYRDKNTFLADEFEKVCNVFYASDNGEIGIHGNVIDAIKANNVNADVVCACGPTPMLRGLVAYSSEKNIKTFISLEEKMACGIGACLACVCKTKEVDEHSHVNNKRICKDGPVFESTEIEL